MNHVDEEEVKNYLRVLDEDLKERRKKRTVISDALRKRGNHLYNLKVVNKEIKGTLLPMRIPANGTYEVTPVTYLTCTFCFGLFRKENLHMHVRSCKENLHPNNSDLNDSEGESPRTPRNRVTKGASQMLVPEQALEASCENLKKYVFPNMLKDKISLIAQSDLLIVKFDSRFHSLHRDKHQYSYTSAKMRDLAKIVIGMQEKHTEIHNLEACIQPKFYDSLVSFVRDLAKYNEETGEMGVPSFAPRVCSSLKSCAEIIKSQAVKESHLITPQKDKIIRSVDGFLHLMNVEWKVEVSSNSEQPRQH